VTGLLTKVITYDRLKVASFVHSTVYVCLLTVWLIPGLHALEFVFGLTHGVGWIAMSLVSLVAVRLRVISLRLAVAVIVLGGVGPFFGTAEFIREGRRRTATGSHARVQTSWP
jgi:hypothetical protein